MIGKQLVHLIRFIIGKDLPATQVTEREVALLKTYAAGAGNAVEIGVFEGYNTAIIAKAIDKNGKLYAVDPFVKGRLGISYHKVIALKHIKRSHVLTKIQLIEDLSFHVEHQIPNSIDFIFIDGDHTYDGIKKDWQIFSHKIRQKGIIALHDTRTFEDDYFSGRGELGSVKFYQDVVIHDPRFEVLDFVDSLTILRRK